MTLEIRAPVQPVAAWVGAVFLALGILGFVPGATTGYEELRIAGQDSGALLFGVFAVSVLLNVVHLVFGVGGLMLGRNPASARLYLIGGGALCLLLWVYGLLTEDSGAANFVPLNAADDWLHFGLGAAMVLLGLVTARAR
ncbi:DUF4383 domain-containing protein [Allokutzneria albata]|uniref:DUF4383 domain-containing protein n=1 Tax=Allokutzneria albata TaxID=211114 RepID=A0A1G9US68_ALLAB|nr:DUF4383 domain-containing protein [Allokutzneria albata]SDM62759.1 protein of unknown function [Allokutzneria albata]